MKKISKFIVIMTLCLSMVLIGLESTSVYANGGDPPIGPTSTPNENE